MMLGLDSWGGGPMDWDGYVIYDPGIDRPPQELPRKEARAAFDRLMDARHERIALLRTLAAADGVDIDADDGVQQLNDWFVASVKASPSNPKRLEPRWYSVVNDIGLFLGELAIARSGGKLRWEFFTAGKKHLSYHSHGDVMRVG
jgi:hypothetical protein